MSYACQTCGAAFATKAGAIDHRAATLGACAPVSCAHVRRSLTRAASGELLASCLDCGAVLVPPPTPPEAPRR